MPDLLPALLMFAMSVATLLYTTWWALIFVFFPNRWRAQELKKLDKKYGPDPDHAWLADAMVTTLGWGYIVASSIIGMRMVVAFMAALEQTRVP